MSILSTISRAASDYVARRRRLHTYLQISSLPLEIQKDIGWPDAYRRGGSVTRKIRNH